MPTITVQNIPDSIFQILQYRAKQHGCSTEAEILQIIEIALQPKIKIGETLAEIGRSVGGATLQIERELPKI